MPPPAWGRGHLRGHTRLFQGGRGVVYVHNGLPPYNLVTGAFGNAAGDRFGYSVAVTRSTTRERGGSLVVGAPQYGSSSVNPGAGYVRVFGVGVLTGGVFAPVAIVLPVLGTFSGDAVNDKFGISVAASGPATQFAKMRDELRAAGWTSSSLSAPLPS